MKIPQGNFGNVIAQPGQQAQVPQDNQITNALGRVGQAVMQVGDDLQQAQQQKQRSQAASVLATLNNDAHDLHDEISRGVADGTVKTEDALPTYQKRFGTLKQERTKGFAPDQLEVIDSHLINTNGTVERNLKGAVVKRTQQDVGANLTNLSEQLQRSAMRDLPGSIETWDKLVDAWGPQAGIDPARMATMKQGFKEGASYNFANATLEGAAKTGNADLIRGAMEKIGGPEGEAIDPARRTALMTKGYGYLNGIEAANIRAQEKSEREAKARENAGENAFNRAYDLWAQGRYFSADEISKTSEIVAGTSMEKPYQELVKSQSTVAGFASKSLTQQEAELERMRAAGSTPGVGVSQAEQKTYEQLDKIHSAGVQAYKENPWQAAQERGVIEDAPTIALNNVQDAQQIIGQRMLQIGQVEIAAGRKISPLQPGEAEQIGKLVRVLPPDQQAGALASFGSMLMDMDRVSDLARQMTEKDKTLGMAMAYANAKTTFGRYTSELILRGERALKDGVVKADSMKLTGWRAEIANEIGDATLHGGTRKLWIDAAYNIQAAISADGGGTNIKRAVELATGGLRKQRDGSNVPRPYGMTDDTFTQRIATLTNNDLAEQAPGGQVFSGGTPIPLDQFVRQLPQASLIHAGPGKYAVRAGTGFVTNSVGRRITIDLNPARPVASPPNGQQGMPQGGKQ